MFDWTAPIEDHANLLCIKQQLAFPEHAHDTFCISLIRQGAEAITERGITTHALAGHISVTNPDVPHSNPLVVQYGPTHFDTLYLSPNLVRACLGQESVYLERSQGCDARANSAFDSVVELLQGAVSLLELREPLTHLLSLLEQSPNEPVQATVEQRWLDLQDHILKSLTSRFTVDALAEGMFLDKFHFSKEFRKRFGLSPMNYVNMHKVFQARELLDDGLTSSDITHTLGFSDQAHFAKQFKRYVGITPRQYALRA